MHNSFIENDMELSSLRIFKTVAEEGGVTQAAARLNRVQSNVSARLTQLEESLGVSLFHRSGRRMLITEDGARLLAYTERHADAGLFGFGTKDFDAGPYPSLQRLVL